MVLRPRPPGRPARTAIARPATTKPRLLSVFTGCRTVPGAASQKPAPRSTSDPSQPPATAAASSPSEAAATSAVMRSGRRVVTDSDWQPALAQCGAQLVRAGEEDAVEPVVDRRSDVDLLVVDEDELLGPEAGAGHGDLED